MLQHPSRATVYGQESATDQDVMAGWGVGTGQADMEEAGEADGWTTTWCHGGWTKSMETDVKELWK